MVIHVQKIIDMKKIYMTPEMEIVELDMLQPILTGSLPMVSDPGSEIDNSGDILAPEGLTGLPSFFFE